MNLDSEELVQQFRADWPGEAETSTLRLLVHKLSQENEQLRSELAAAKPPSAGPSGFLGPSNSYSLDETSVMTRG